MLKRFVSLMLPSLAMALASGIYAQTPVTKIMVPYPAGGTSDFVARAFVDRFQRHLGSPVVIENKAGANGAIGAQFVARAAPDGHTLLLPGTAAITINPHVYKNLSYDPISELVPVARLTVAGSALFISNSHPAKSLKEYVSWAQARGKPLTFGSAGAGGTTHVWIEAFQAATGLKTLHVPYKGVSFAAIDIASGEIDGQFSDIAPLLPLVQAGKLKMLALIGSERNRALPDLPTFSEQGYPGMSGLSWYGLMAPVKTPPEIVRRIAEAARKALEDPALTNQFIKSAMSPGYLESENFGKIVRTDYEWWGNLVRQHGVKAD